MQPSCPNLETVDRFRRPGRKIPTVDLRVPTGDVKTSWRRADASRPCDICASLASFASTRLYSQSAGRLQGPFLLRFGALCSRSEPLRDLAKTQRRSKAKLCRDADWRQASIVLAWLMETRPLCCVRMCVKQITTTHLQRPTRVTIEFRISVDLWQVGNLARSAVGGRAPQGANIS